MKIIEFVKMWKDDNAVEDMLLMEENKHPDGVEDRLYHVLYRNGRGGNGRHEALRVRIAKDQEVISHEIFNLHGEEWGNKDARLDPNNNDGTNYSSQVTGWFNGWTTNYLAGTTTATANVRFINSTTTGGTF